MTTEKSKPKAISAWCLTVGAIFAQISFGFSIAGNGGLSLLIPAALAAAGLCISAVNEWKKYLEAFVRYVSEPNTNG